jgi:hypothetical protein
MLNNKSLYLLLLLGSGIYFYQKGSLDNLIIVCLLVIFIFVFFNNKEHLSTDEAVENIAQMYNNKKLTVTDLDVLGNLTVKNKAIVDKNLTVHGTSNIHKTAYFNDMKVGHLHLRGDRIGNPGANCDLQLRGSGWLGWMLYNKDALHNNGMWMNQIEINHGPGGADKVFRNYVKRGDNIRIQGKRGILDNYHNRCNEGDDDRTIQVTCAQGGHGGSEHIWRII